MKVEMMHIWWVVYILALAAAIIAVVATVRNDAMIMNKWSVEQMKGIALVLLTVVIAMNGGIANGYIQRQISLDPRQ